ncbi:MAG: hypothetical protein ABUL55_03305 [Pseudomonadota bacterium]
MRRALIVVALLLGGCVPQSFYTRPLPLDAQADQFNTVTAQSERLMILRNVMRARDRTSMVFTRIDSFQGSMSRSLESTASAGLAEGPHNDSLAPGVTVSGEASPNFNITVLNDQKFHRAIESSIDLGIYKSLLEDGWRPQLLHTLFIERIVIGNETYNNDPSNPEQFQRFQTWLLAHPSLQVCSGSDVEDFGPPLGANTLSDLQGLAALAGQGLEVRAEGNHWQLGRTQQNVWLAFNCDDPNSALESVGRQLGQSTADNPTPTGQYVTSSANGQSLGEGKANRIYVRSIEGVLFYLGEIVRAEHRAANDDDPLRIQIDNSNQPLFVIHRASAGHASGMVFRHEDGQTYYVPYPDFAARGDAHDRTHQVVTLLLQLIGVLQEREAVPTTQTVRVVG